MYTVAFKSNYSSHLCQFQYGGRSTSSKKKMHTVSSSFSIPVGICGTDRFMVAKSGRSGISSALKTGIGLAASSARARNVTLLILLCALQAKMTDTMWNFPKISEYFGSRRTEQKHTVRTITCHLYLPKIFTNKSEIKPYYTSKCTHISQFSRFSSWRLNKPLNMRPIIQLKAECARMRT